MSDKKKNAVFKKLFLPLGLLSAVAVAIAAPGIASSLNKASVTPWLVSAIFLVNGFQTGIVKVQSGRSFSLLFACVALVNLIIAPLIGTGVAKMMMLSTGLTLGLIVISTVPPTLSSGVVITEVAGGNVLWALMTTIGLNLIGIFTIPFMLAVCVDVEGGVSISALGLLVKLIKIVLVPFLIGMILKKLVKPKKIPAVINFIPSICIIITVWLTLSASRNELVAMKIWSVLLIILCSLIVHGILFILCGGAGKLLKFNMYDLKAMVFVGSQKTLPVAVSVLTCIGGGIGIAVVVCVVFHFSQLFVDSAIASWMGALPAVAQKED